MPRIKSSLDTGSPAFQENAAHHRALASDLRSQVARVSEGGGADAQKKHVARGKLLPRERVRALLDRRVWPGDEWAPGAARFVRVAARTVGAYEDLRHCALQSHPFAYDHIATAAFRRPFTLQ